MIFFSKKDDSVISVGNNYLSYSSEDKKYLNIKVIGDGNKIIVKKLASNSTGKLEINVFGDNNLILVDENLFIGIWPIG